MRAEVPVACGLCGEQFFTLSLDGRIVKRILCPKCGSAFTFVALKVEPNREE